MKRTVTKLVAVMMAGLFMMSASVAGMPSGIFKIEKVYGANEIGINQTNFPDAALCNYLSENYDSDNDGCIDDVADVTQIMIGSSSEVTSLAGIEKFNMLISIYVYNCKFEAVDLTACTNLGIVYFQSEDSIKTVNVTGLTDVWSLSITSTALNSVVGIENLPNLKYLTLSKTALTSLDLRNNTQLINVNVSNSNLETLLVKGLSSMTRLWCYSNRLTELDLEGCTSLVVLSCGDNNWNSAEPLNLSDIYNISDLSCGSSKDTSAKIQKLTIPSGSKLTRLYVDGNGLTSLDVTAATNLQYLSCEDNPLTTLNINNAALQYLYAGSNASENISLVVNTNNCPALTTLWVSGSVANVIIDNANLNTVNVNSTHLWTLDVSNAPALASLTVVDVNELVLSNNTKLRYVKLEGIDSESLDFSGCPELYYISLTNMASLSSVNFTGCVAMKEISMKDCNKIKRMSVADSQVFERLYNNSAYGLMAFDMNPNNPEAQLSNGGAIYISATDKTYDLKEILPTIEESKITDFKSKMTYVQSKLTISGTVISDYRVGENMEYYYDCGNGQTMKVQLTVKSVANSWVTPLTMEDWTYGQTPSEPYAEAKMGTVKYSYSDSVDGQYTSLKPKNAGTWYVKAYVSSSAYYNDLEPIIKEFKIKKAVPQHTLPTNLKGYVGQTLADVKLPEGFQWRGSANDVLARPGKAGSVISYPLMYVPEDTDNYVTVYNLSVSVEVITSGDINGDDVINVADAVALKKVLAGINENIVEADSDVNMDGVINVTDAVILMKFLAGQDVEMGVAS